MVAYDKVVMSPPASLEISWCPSRRVRAAFPDGGKTVCSAPASLTDARRLQIPRRRRVSPRLAPLDGVPNNPAGRALLALRLTGRAQTLDFYALLVGRKACILGFLRQQSRNRRIIELGHPIA